MIVESSVTFGGETWNGYTKGWVRMLLSHFWCESRCHAREHATKSVRNWRGLSLPSHSKSSPTINNIVTYVLLILETWKRTYFFPPLFTAAPTQIASLSLSLFKFENIYLLKYSDESSFFHFSSLFLFTFFLSFFHFFCSFFSFPFSLFFFNHFVSTFPFNLTFFQYYFFFCNSFIPFFVFYSPNSFLFFFFSF